MFNKENITTCIPVKGEGKGVEESIVERRDNSLNKSNCEMINMYNTELRSPSWISARVYKHISPKVQRPQCFMLSSNDSHILNKFRVF